MGREIPNNVKVTFMTGIVKRCPAIKGICGFQICSMVNHKAPNNTEMTA